MYTFIHEEPKREYVHGWPTTHHTKKIEFTVEDDSGLEELCDAFEHFLKACGYEFDGNVEIVDQKSYCPEFQLMEYELDPDKRDWQYDCEGNKVVKGDFTTLYKPKKKLWDATPEEWNQAYKTKYRYE